MSHILFGIDSIATEMILGTIESNQIKSNHITSFVDLVYLYIPTYVS